MDCSICSALPLVLRPPRNIICGACHEAATRIINFINKPESDHRNAGGVVDKSNTSLIPLPNSTEGLANVLKWMKETKEVEKEQDQKIQFLSGFAAAFRDQLHCDILVKPGSNGPPIPAHRALLASRSEIFKNMLEADGCKAPPKEAIALPELTHEELESLLEFLYRGSLPPKKAQKHVYSLLIAADKYEIPFLQRFCQAHMLESLDMLNALEVLEISDACSNQSLKEAALEFVVKYLNETVFSDRYEAFALKNPHLGVQITRALVIDSLEKSS